MQLSVNASLKVTTYRQYRQSKPDPSLAHKWHLPVPYRPRHNTAEQSTSAEWASGEWAGIIACRGTRDNNGARALPIAAIRARLVPFRPETARRIIFFLAANSAWAKLVCFIIVLGRFDCRGLDFTNPGLKLN